MRGIPNPIGKTLRAVVAALEIVSVLALTVALGQSAPAQTFKAVHRFTGGLDGAYPFAGVTIDSAGNLYGTTYAGGIGYGTVFKLGKRGSGWILSSLHRFRGGNDGVYPTDRVIIGADGNLYGQTQYGGGGPCACGTVFKLIALPGHAMAPWPEAVLYRFTGYSDGGFPSGDLVLDKAGNLYGTTVSGGPPNVGTAYQLMSSRGGWTFSLIHTFQDYNDGENSYSGLIFDKAGNLYGTTAYGGAYNNGTVFQLLLSGSGWTENLLYSFQNGSDGGHPYTGLVLDKSGSLYGTTGSGGPGNSGTVFELTPAGGNWVYTVLHSFGGDGGTAGGLTMDTAGNIYGTTYLGGAYKSGSVFKMTPSNGGWAYADLHDFDPNDGEEPVGAVILDASGNLYGTASAGGGNGYGVVWEIMP